MKSSQITTRLIEQVSAVVFSGIFAQLIFWLFPTVWFMASNADSLVLLDFASDILSGKVLQYWNLPRAPYLFPDTAIALVVMLIGWVDHYSLVLIATINFWLLSYVSYQLYQNADTKKSISLFQTQLAIASTLLLLGACFPAGMTNLYWQIFASGAHFLTAIIVAAIITLAGQAQSNALTKRRLALIGFLCFSQAISDSLSLVLLASWWAVYAYQCRHRWREHYPQLVLIPLMMALGTIASFFLPRQDLVGSFFSLAQFKLGALAFWQWVTNTPINALLLVVLFLGALLWPIVSNGISSVQMPNQSKNSITRVWHVIQTILRNGFVLPSIAIFCLTPIFYQEVGSLRYLSFPGFVCLLTLGLVLIRILQAVEWRPTDRTPLPATNIALAAIFGIVALGSALIYHTKDAPQDNGQKNFDLIGLIAAAADANAAAACIAKASLQHPLKAGVATYWSARPVRFATHSEYYLAQTNPWRPRSGHFVWGNNALDFVYQDYTKGILRQYNFVIASHHEILAGLWKSLSKKATHSVECSNHTLYFYDDVDVLWNYLFPYDTPLPAPLDDRAASQLSTRPTQAIDAAQTAYLADELFTLVGENTGQVIRAKGASGFLVFGPYVPLERGTYNLQIIGALQAPNEAPGTIGVFDVMTQGGKQQLLQAPINTTTIKSKQIAQVQFTLDKPVRDAEFRLFIFPGVQGQFERFEIQKMNSPKEHKIP